MGQGQIVTVSNIVTESNNSKMAMWLEIDSGGSVWPMHAYHKNDGMTLIKNIKRYFSRNSIFVL